VSGFNIYMTGVGGQGIGMLSEVLIRAVDHAGLAVRGVDTHGLAQRGGIVVSHLRIGTGAHSPLIPPHGAHLAAALERHEALRAAGEFLAEAGTLVYYDTVWQPLEVRLGSAREVTNAAIAAVCNDRGVNCLPVFREDLADVRMQNVVLLAVLAGRGLVPGLAPDHYRRAMGDLMAGGMLAANLALFDEERARHTATQ
jgi:indolepyruvate ferredoxin oxidoreductase beta subunit